MGPYVRFGPTMVEGHLTWQGKTFDPGHVAELEVAAVRRRYNAPILRYAVAGPVEGDLAVCAEAVQLGMEAVRRATKPGAVGSEVRQAAYEVGTDHLRSDGVEATYLPGGYSVGIGYPPGLDRGRHHHRLERLRTPAERPVPLRLVLPTARVAHRDQRCRARDRGRMRVSEHPPSRAHRARREVTARDHNQRAGYPPASRRKAAGPRQAEGTIPERSAPWRSAMPQPKPQC